MVVVDRALAVRASANSRDLFSSLILSTEPSWPSSRSIVKRKPWLRNSNPDERVDWRGIDALTRRRRAGHLRGRVKCSYAMLKAEFLRAVKSQQIVK